MVKSYQDLVYNAHGMLKDYYSYEEISYMPLKDLFRIVEYFRPKLQEIARRQSEQQLELELQGKKGMVKPGSKKRW